MSSSSRTSREVHVEIVVQPPSMVGASRWLMPPVVARTSDPHLTQAFMNNEKHVYATSMLTSSSGEDYSTVLNGTWNTNANLVTTGGHGGGSSRHARTRWLYFVFSPVSIGLPGSYTFSVVVSALSLVENTAVVVGGRSTGQVTVVNQAIPPERPSSSERQVLRQLQAAGLYDPGPTGNVQSPGAL